MLIASVSDFRKDIKSYLDKVAKNFETLIINRGKDSGIVVMSLTEYNSLMATNHELSSRKNELRLDSAIEKLSSQKSFEKNILEDQNMKYIFVDESWEDYLYWQKTDKKKLKRINDLLKDISRSPFDGIGKPEPLKHKYSGFWSRRIDDEHRLIYRYEEGEIQIAKCRFHYD